MPHNKDDEFSTTPLKSIAWKPISWSSKRQLTVSTSTAEVEYVAECNAAKEAQYLTGALTSVGYEDDDVQAVRLLTDNQAAIKLANDPINHRKTKHINIKYHFVRELVAKRGLLRIPYISTDQMVADGLTKPLEATKFKAFTGMLGLAPSGG